MARTQKNAAGEDVRVDTPAYGCITVEHGSPKTTKTKTEAAKPADDEGDE